VSSNFFLSLSLAAFSPCLRLIAAVQHLFSQWFRLYLGHYFVIVSAYYYICKCSMFTLQNFHAIFFSISWSVTYVSDVFWMCHRLVETKHSSSEECFGLS
jgi:hypothetical protein